jgi:RecA/RadA recombinase
MTVAVLDVEGTFDVQWATKLGVDPDKMLLSRPDNAEQALDIGEALIRSKECDVVVLDSIAFMTPLAEIQESASKELVGTQARTMGKGVRKFVSALNWVENSEDGWKPTIFLTNQIRMKVGVLFGCFPYEAPVLLANGTYRNIGEIVNQKQQVEVLSWNEGEKRFEPRRVVRWWKQGVDVDDWCLTDSDICALKQEYRTLVIPYPGSKVYTEITATPNHLIATTNGFTPVERIDLGDEIVCCHEQGMYPCSVAKIIRFIKDGYDAIRYNLEVEGNATYVVRNVVVHNSPEVQPGGLAPGFAASTELKLISTKYTIEKDAERPTCVDISYRVEKNKTGVPRIEGSYRLMLSDTQSKSMGSVYDEDYIIKQAQRLELLTGAGVSWEILDHKFKSKTAVEEELLSNPTFSKEIRSVLMKVLMSA